MKGMLKLKDYLKKRFECDDIIISDDNFGFFSEKPLNHDERCCEIILKIESSEFYPELGLTKGDKLVPRKKIPFWVGIDDPGQSIFSDIEHHSAAEDPRRSWFSGFPGSGYTFHINQAHPAFDRIKKPR